MVTTPKSRASSPSRHTRGPRERPSTPLAPTASRGHSRRNRTLARSRAPRPSHWSRVTLTACPRTSTSPVRPPAVSSSPSKTLCRLPRTSRSQAKSLRGGHGRPLRVSRRCPGLKRGVSTRRSPQTSIIQKPTSYSRPLTTPKSRECLRASRRIRPRTSPACLLSRTQAAEATDKSTNPRSRSGSAPKAGRENQPRGMPQPLSSPSRSRTRQRRCSRGTRAERAAFKDSSTRTLWRGPKAAVAERV